MSRRAKALIALVLAVAVAFAVVGVLALAGGGKTPSKIAIATLTAAFVGSAGYLVKYGLDKVIEAIRSESPLECTVETDPSKIATFSSARYEVLIPRRRITPAPQAPGSLAFHQWAVALGGMPSGTAMLRLVVKAKASPVVLTAIRARVVSREAVAPEGVRLLRPTAGVAEVRRMHVDLDRDELALQWQRRSGRSAAATFTLEPQESEIFDVTATLSRGRVLWVLVVDYIADGKSRSRSVPDDGFLELVAAGSAPYTWDFQDGWSRDDGVTLSTARLFEMLGATS